MLHYNWKQDQKYHSHVFVQDKFHFKHFRTGLDTGWINSTEAMISFETQANKTWELIMLKRSRIAFHGLCSRVTQNYSKYSPDMKETMQLDILFKILILIQKHAKHILT